MVSVFAGFIFSHLTMVRPIGFALALGVLLDAFVVRMTLIPAAMHLFGRPHGGCPAGWTRSCRTWMWKAPSWFSRWIEPEQDQALAAGVR